MGKKRRLIKKTGKFIHKHSNHPILKQRNLSKGGIKTKSRKADRSRIKAKSRKT